MTRAKRALIAHLTTVHRLRDPRIFHKEIGSLRAAGYDVRLVAQHTADEVVDGVPVTALSMGGGRRRRIGRLAEVLRRARALHADVYHIHDPELIPVAYALKVSTGARIIYDIHEDYPTRPGMEGRLLEALENWCFRWVDHAIVVHEGLRRQVAARGVPATLVANYFKPRTSHRPTPKTWDGTSPFELLYTGVIAEVRGLGTLLDLAGRIGTEGLPWRMNVVGVCYRAAERTAATPTLARPDVQAGLRLVGWDAFVPPDEIAPFFRAAHVGLVPWLPNPNHVVVSTKFYEYLHHGLPILCSDFPQWRAFIEKHQCGAVFDPHDPGAAFAILKQWAADPALYARLSAASAAAAPAYGWATMEANLLAAYEAVLSRMSSRKE